METSHKASSSSSRAFGRKSWPEPGPWPLEDVHHGGDDSEDDGGEAATEITGASVYATGTSLSRGERLLCQVLFMPDWT